MSMNLSSSSNVNLAWQLCLSQSTLEAAQIKTTSKLTTSNHSSLNTNYTSRERLIQNKIALAQQKSSQK